jgi:hypothetical protein
VVGNVSSQNNALENYIFIKQASRHKQTYNPLKITYSDLLIIG